MWIKDTILSLFVATAPLQHTPPAELPPIPIVEEAPQPRKCAEKCKATDAGLALIRSYEGYSPFIYKDAVGLPTIGFGHLIMPGEKFKEPLMQQEADTLLRRDVAVKEADVNRLVYVGLFPGQFDAITSFTFNLGAGALKSSTMLKRVNAEAHHEVPAQIKRWNKAGKKVLRGLTLRREAEARMYQAAQ